MENYLMSNVRLILSQFFCIFCTKFNKFETDKSTRWNIAQADYEMQGNRMLSRTEISWLWQLKSPLQIAHDRLCKCRCEMPIMGWEIARQKDTAVA